MKHPPEAAVLEEASRRLGIVLTGSQAGRLLQYERLLLERAIPLGLIGPSDAPRLRERHILDCLRAAAATKEAATALDLGSGAGLPGIVVAIALPDLRLGLVDSRRSRVSFLELAVDVLELSNARVIARRVETLDEQVDVCFSRAFAPLHEAWAQAARLLAPGGRLVYFAGGGPELGSISPGDHLLEGRSPLVLESVGGLVIMTRQ